MSATPAIKFLHVRMLNRGRLFAVISLICIVLLSLQVSRANASEDLFELSLDELMAIEVTSVSKRSQKLSDVASSIFVIDNKMIRHSGVTTLPDAFALAPGVDVNRIYGDTFSLSVRGFNGRFTNKLLVLVDGRSIYTPTFAGVFWEVETLPLEEIERIEVIRGAAGSVWGVNAMNGVINIITRAPNEDDGQQIAITAGNGPRMRSYFSTSDQIGSAAYRLSAQSMKDESLMRPSQTFAMDRYPKSDHARLSVTIEDDAWHHALFAGSKYYITQYDSLTNTIAVDPLGGLDSILRVKNNFLMFRSTYQHPESAETIFQFYVDRSDYLIEAFLRDVGSRINDAELRHNREMGNHSLTLGLGHRTWVYNDLNASFGGQRIDLETSTVFVQDDIRLLNDKALLTLGFKAEETYFSDVEIQPTAKLLYQWHSDLSTWASWGRLVRTPSVVENELVLPLVLPNVDPAIPADRLAVAVMGNSTVKPEEMKSTELGLRYRFSDQANLEWSLFYHDYEDLIFTNTASTVMNFPGLVDELVPTRLISPINGINGLVKGSELLLRFRPRSDQEVIVSYDYTDSKFSVEDSEGTPPRHRVKLNYSHQVSSRTTLSTIAHYTSDYTMRNAESNPTFDEYVALSVNVGFQLTPSVEVSISGRNLVDSNRVEGADTIPLRAVENHPLKEQWVIQFRADL